MMETEAKIDKFIFELQEYGNSDGVANPYLEESLRSNLKHYFELMMQQPGPRILIVGEAPGYDGCRITGIPFTSGAAIKNVNHPILAELRPLVELSSIESEKTSTIVWEYLLTLKFAPLFWNSFPFHPYPGGNNRDNRRPTSSEISDGVYFLKEIFSLFQAEAVFGLGRAGEDCAKQAFPEKDVQYIRHPSRGGKPAFISGMDEKVARILGKV